MVGVRELERQGVRPGLELHRRLLLRLTVVQVRGVERDRLALLYESAVDHDVMVPRALLQALRSGRNLAIGLPASCHSIVDYEYRRWLENLFAIFL